MPLALPHWPPCCCSQRPGDGPRHRGATLRGCRPGARHQLEFYQHHLASVPVFVGALLGEMLIFLFSSFAIKAVGRTAQYIIEDVRAQFRENPGIMAGTSKPDYGRCVRIVTGAALKQMVLPGALAVLTPLVVGLVFRNLSSSFQIHISGEYSPVLNGHSDQPCRRGSSRGPAYGGDHRRHPDGHADEQQRRRWDNAKKYI